MTIDLSELTDLDAVYRAIGQKYVELVRGQPVEFAAKKGGKGTKKTAKPNCTPGKSFSCGYSCQSVKRSCKNPLEGQAGSYAEWLSMQAGGNVATAPENPKPAKKAKAAAKKPASQPEGKPTEQDKPKQSIKIPSERQAKKEFLQVGQGAFGAVYIDPKKRDAAYKYGEILDREVELTRKASDLGVAPKFLGGDRKGYATEFLAEHTPLVNAVKSKSFSSLENARELNKNILSTFQKLHTNGLTHNDVHAGNIMINPKTGDVRLIDFGMASQSRPNWIVSDIKALSEMDNFTRTTDGRKFKQSVAKLEKAQAQALQKAQQGEKGKYDERLNEAIATFYGEVSKLDLSPTLQKK